MPSFQVPSGFSRFLPLAALACCLLLSAALWAQEAPVDKEEALEPFVGRKIVQIDVSGARRNRPELLLSSIETQKGRRLDLATLREDIRFLWSRFKIRAAFKVRNLPGDAEQGLRLLLAVEEFPSFRRIEFQGLSHFTDAQLRRLLEMDEGESPTELTGRHYARLLEERYRQDGYAFVVVRVLPDERRGVLVLQIGEGPKVRIRSFDFVGNKSYPATSFIGFRWNLLGSAGVRNKPGPSLLPFLAGIYSKDKLEEDFDRIETWYRERGFLDAIVELRTLRFTKDRSGVHIVARVHEGKRYKVSGIEVDITPAKGGAKPAFDPERLKKLLALKVGEYLGQEVLDRDMDKIREFYGKRGYPDWERYRTLSRANTLQVLDPSLVVDPEKGSVKVVYRVLEGQKKSIRFFDITGNELTRDHVIRRDMRVHPGEPLNEVELERGRKRLISRQYFGDLSVGDPGVRLRLLPVEGRDDLVDLELDVSEASTGRILFGANFSTNAGFFASVSYNKRNFDWTRPPTGINPIDWFVQLIRNEAWHGAGQTLNLNLRPGTKVSQIDATFYEPDVFGRQYETIGMQLSGQRQLRGYRTYSGDTLGGSVIFDRRFGTDWKVSAGFRIEHVTVDQVRGDAPRIVWDAEGGTEMRSLLGRISWAELDRQPRPTSGARASAYVEYAPEWLGGQSSFYKVGAELRTYIPVYEDSRRRRHVFNTKLRLDLGQGIDGSDDLYLSKRFYMGGQSNLRGFDYRGAGPTQFRNPVGGEVRFLGTAQYIFPILSTRYEERFEETDIVRGLFFVDAGMLGDSFQDEQFKDIRVSTGIGFRFLVPGIIGGEGLPINIDFGWPLRREASDKTKVFNFSISFGS
ncbi:MAG: hypothetical protein CSA62_07390 [Planctomycetota bacterium]|nr:MAG: hypothetical protein CSA62_07390 [Planctomycetota bacterium]